jgi:hypothetical protein
MLFKILIDKQSWVRLFAKEFSGKNIIVDIGS